MSDGPAVVRTLRSMGSERDREGMARFGINTDRALGVSVTALRRMARGLGRDHGLAAELWASGILAQDSRSARWIARDALRELGHS